MPRPWWASSTRNATSAWVVLGPVVAAHTDQLVAQGQDERDPIDVVDLGEPLDVAVAELGIGREEAQVLRLGRDPVVELDQLGRIRGPDRPQVGHSPIGEQDIGLPLGGVARGVDDLAC